MRLVLLLCACLFPTAAFAQATVSGRVVDAKSDEGLPGVTVLQTGTTNGVSSDVHGYFSFSVPGQPDSVALTVSSIGYLTRRLRVATGSTRIVRLTPDEKAFVADAGVMHYPYLGVGLSSGTRYAPFGATLLLGGRHFLHLPISATGSFQTNFSSNHSLLLGLVLPPIREYGRVTVGEEIHYDHLQATAPSLRFSSYTFTTKLRIYRIGHLLMPTLLLGAGYGRYQSLHSEALPEHGYGYCFGLQHEFLPYPFRLFATAQATHWPTFWQWQGQLAHPFARHFWVGIEGNYLRQYAEVSLTVSRYFYKGI
ncbi:carboxypeptidase-like regulatory domain-containing protein [Hymenobacter sp. BT523]|uniref:carboxypeptidase-like regulatory domain-containing protein n=1 Tax=Hymenobacter sp. BT523 TaxID=2795725 RepID=UPI0018ECD431|nr:carboxypeptidase-like regulatory domain-containing protein [Hymenobacter sp. BT523]MBJ6108237.1 carboxypeptidase-like regulatory domain-containing protein [Hymenobacter sp. BT523]